MVAAASALAPFHIPAENRLKGRYIVVLEDGVDLDSFISRFQQKVTVETAVERKFSTALNGFVLQADVAGRALNLLRSFPGVKYIEEDEVISIYSANYQPGSWGIDRIDQFNKELDDEMNLEGYGEGVHVYVIDTGINVEHEDFHGRAFIGGDFIGGDGDDCNGHGTHCAGTVASATYGVANEAYVYGLRTLNCFGSGQKSSSIAALDWVASSGERPAVVSMSLGGSYSEAQNEAVTNTKNAGAVVVVAAGNSDTDACSSSPASAPDAITVGSTDSEDTRSYFSNYGPCVDLFAPGSDIVSLTHNSNTGSTTLSGTSMACPHVSGIAAVLLGLGNTVDEAYDSIKNGATNDVVEDPMDTPNKLAYCA
ncbi:aqualysin-1-like [Diadema antillarum]|uniref:aqualysin-1-like n=1 Tax=Diadema antillarum TaxID=105358 RepID=UPI003A8BB3B4